MIEHLDPPRLAAFERTCSARPAGTVVLTTPNAEYNRLLGDAARGQFRHPDHRFEWTRAEFERGPAASPAHGYACASCRSARRTPRSARRRRWRCSRDEDRRSPSSAWSCWSAPGPARSRSRRAHFLPTEVLSSDFCRGARRRRRERSDATEDAFDVLHFIAAQRLARGRLTVVDATNVQREARQPLIELAREHDLFPVAIVFDLPEASATSATRAARPRLRRRTSSATSAAAAASLRGLQREGFRARHVCARVEEVDAVEIEARAAVDRPPRRAGPFDIIGDIHGCTTSSRAAERARVRGRRRATPPTGRKAVFVGDSSTAARTRPACCGS